MINKIIQEEKEEDNKIQIKKKKIIQTKKHKIKKRIKII